MCVLDQCELKGQQHASDAELIFGSEWHQTGGGGGVSEVGCGPPFPSDVLKVNTSTINSFNELTAKKRRRLVGLH